MRIQSLSSCAMLAAVTLLAACGGDSSTQPNNDLSAEQATSMTSALGTVLGTALVQSQSISASRIHSGARTSVRDQASYSYATPCPEGGRLAVSGSASEESGNLHFVTVDTLDACAGKDSHGAIWTFTTDPVFTTTLDLSGFGESQLTTMQTDAGKVRFSSGDLSGSCSIDLSIDTQLAIGVPTADSATVTQHGSGKVCGRSVTTSVVVTVPWVQYQPS